MSYQIHHRSSGGSTHRLPAPPPDSLPNASFVQAVVSCSIGSFVEYYDFYVFLFFEKHLKKAFFPNSYTNHDVNLLLFYMPYLIRPFAALLFGFWSDRYGRRSTLIITTFAMGIPTVLIGCMPKYDDIGIWASVLVTGLRFAQVKITRLSSPTIIFHLIDNIQVSRTLQLSHTDLSHISNVT